MPDDNQWVGTEYRGGAPARVMCCWGERSRAVPGLRLPPPKPGAHAGGMVTTYEAKGRVAESHLSGQGQGAGGRWWRVLPDSARSRLDLG